uniref:F-box associated domain-containing protein n=1 Tax=Leersia perrieri TaxID=77586 RepID=A0A0D9XUG3_9ORYZ
MEWSPSPWKVEVFSSRTSRLWKERTFVRDGEPLGTVEDMRMDPSYPTGDRPRQWYGVYHQGALYVHCRGHFVARFSFSNDKYQIIKTPEENSENYEFAKPFLGRAKNGICYGIIGKKCQPQIWILRESCGQMDWILKHTDDLKHFDEELRTFDYTIRYIRLEVDGSKHEKNETLSKVNSEWDSDNDDFISVTVLMDSTAMHGFKSLDSILIKKLSAWCIHLKVVAYHLNSSKMQYLGYSHPKSYDLSNSNGIYESFPYTPCMTGELRWPRRHAKKKTAT